MCAACHCSRADLPTSCSVYNARADQLTVFERNVLDSIKISGRTCTGMATNVHHGNCSLPGAYRENLIGVAAHANEVPTLHPLYLWQAFQ